MIFAVNNEGLTQFLVKPMPSTIPVVEVKAFCCEWVKEEYESRDGPYRDRFYFVFSLIGEVQLWQCDADCSWVPFNFCPNCGAKTEVNRK